MPKVSITGGEKGERPEVVGVEPDRPLQRDSSLLEPLLLELRQSPVENEQGRKMRVEPLAGFDLRFRLGGLADIDQGIGEIGVTPGIARLERDGGLELLDGVVVPATAPRDVSGHLMRGRGRMSVRQ